MSFETRTAPRHPLATPGFTIERLPMLKTAFESIARDVLAAMRELTGIQCVVNIEHIGIESLTDIRTALGEGGTAALLAASGWEYPIMVHASRPLVLSCLDMVFGGDGSTGAEGAFKPVTKTERKFSATMMRKLGDTVRTSLKALIEPELVTSVIDEAEDFERVLSRGQAAGVVQLRIDHREPIGYLLVAIPQIVLLTIRHMLTKDSEASTTGTDPAWRRKLETELQSARVSLHAVLREKGFTLGDVAGFQVGKLIELQAPIKGRVLLRTPDESMFNCELGQADGHYSIRVESAVSHQETAIEEIASEFSDLQPSMAEGVETTW
jgi:flagellar motor switch protein FliM